MDQREVEMEEAGKLLEDEVVGGEECAGKDQIGVENVEEKQEESFGLVNIAPNEIGQDKEEMQGSTIPNEVGQDEEEMQVNTGLNEVGQVEEQMQGNTGLNEVGQDEEEMQANTGPNEVGQVDEEMKDNTGLNEVGQDEEEMQAKPGPSQDVQDEEAMQANTGLNEVGQDEEEMRGNTTPIEVKQDEEEMQANTDPNEVGQDEEEMQVKKDPNETGQDEEEMQANKVSNEIGQDEEEMRGNTTPNEVKQDEEEMQINKGPNEVGQDEEEMQANTILNEIGQDEEEMQANKGPNEIEQDEEEMQDNKIKQESPVDEAHGSGKDGSAMGDDKVEDSKIDATYMDEDHDGSLKMPESNNEGGYVGNEEHQELLEYSPDKVEDHNTPTLKNVLEDTKMDEGYESGTPEDQETFMNELEAVYREKGLEFKPPKFYGQPLNCLKLWRSVVKLGGYDRVTGSKLWRQVGESFHPPKTCTTVSYTFRQFYEKALLEYERHKVQIGELEFPLATVYPETPNVENETPGSGPGRARRDAAARAMQGWHAQRLVGFGEEKNNNSQKREKSLKSIGSLKQKRPTEVEYSVKAARTEASRQLRVNYIIFRFHICIAVFVSFIHILLTVSFTSALTFFYLFSYDRLVTTVADVGPPANWVKINVLVMKDCFEVYALVPGLLREEVRVQSDPAGRVVITGQPEQPDNPWGITAFKKVITLPSRIDALRTSAVVSLHGRLLVRVPFEQ